MSQFYIYQHRRNDTGSVFYVGKGTNNRAWQSGASRRNSHWTRISKKHGHSVEIVTQGLDENLALLAEVELIDKYKRLGIQLVNQTDGGDGVTLTSEQLLLRNASIRNAYKRPEVKARLSAAISASRKSNREKFSAIAKSSMARPEVKAKMSASVKAAKAKASFAGKQSEASSKGWENRRKPVECVEASKTFQTAMQAVVWLKETGHPKASGSAISEACKGTRNSAYGYTWRNA